MGITVHLNIIVKLQDKDLLATDMQLTITAFEIKLHLWKAQMANGQFVYKV